MKGLNLSTSLSEIYENLLPSVQKVLKNLSFPDPRTLDEKRVLDALKRFVKNCTPAQLKNFMRFCTGSTLMGKPIVIDVTPRMSEVQRRPIAHTCGPTLELSLSYSDYVVLRSDFLNIFRSDYQVMDYA